LSVPRVISGASGANALLWGRDGTSLRYVAPFVVRSISRAPERVASPPSAPGDWSTDYGEVPRLGQFACSGAAS
jgi:hypothetical protein